MTGIDLMPAPWRGPVGEPGAVEGANLRLEDLSRHRRFGVKGRGALAWLAERGLAQPAGNNRAAATDGKILLARLGPGEALLLATGDGGGVLLDDLSKRLRQDLPADCYAVPRQDSSAWFRLTGAGAPALLAHLCAVDLRPEKFGDGAIAQTSVALHNAVVIRRDARAVYGLDIVADFAGAAYFWKILSNSVRETADA